MKKLIAILLSSIIAASTYATNLAVSMDADYYMYYGTYNSTRTPLYIGINNLTAGSPYQYHFNVGGLEINNISGFNSGYTGLLKLNLQRFRVPVAVDPSYQGPPSYQYLTSGVTFTMRAVALTDSFSNIETATDPLLWYTTNLLNRPTLDTVTFNQAGEVSFNITSALEQWKIDPLTNFGIGLIGTYSSVEGTTAQFYSLDYTSDLSKIPTVSIIPEPTILKYAVTALVVILIIRQFAK